VAELEAVAGAFADLGCELYAAETWGQVAARGEEAGMQRRSAAAHRAMVDCRQRCERARTPLLATSTTAVSLSPRERQIARLAASGMPRRDIAAHLVISPRTVDSHLQRIYRKLGVEDRQGLAAALPPRPPDSDAPRALTG
jgi:DNA-binding CsgD family transcriptional regulator